MTIALPCAAQVAAAPVEYVKVCPVYGEGFHYIPGTDICINGQTGDARVATEGGTWRSRLPYPEGRWVATPAQDCTNGRLVNLGTFAATDFTPNPWNRLQTQSVGVRASAGEFVSRVIMSGGFYDPRQPTRSGTNGRDGLCVRSTDPGVLEPTVGGGSESPPWGNGGLPVGCIAN
ncbi:MAG: porin [Burkholderiales bacterium]